MSDVTAVIDVLAHEAAKDPASLTPETDLMGLGITSLDMMNVLFSLEDRFGVVLEFDDLEKAKTIGDLAALITSKCAKTETART